LQWQLIKTTGTKPGAISYHKSVVKDDNMYLFGGMSPDGECNGELYILNLLTYEWSIDPTQQDRPEPRDDISMTSSDTALFVYGGFFDGKRMNDLYMFSFETKTWERLSEFHDVNEFSPEEAQTKYPCPRSGQDIAFYKNIIYMFGGRNDFNDKLNDIWEFNIAAKTWTIIELDDVPIGRSHHTLVTESDRMILFGGIVEITKEINEIHQYDFNSKEWTTIDDKSDHAPISPAKINEVKMNETAPIRSQNAMKTLELKRDANNKSMKKMNSKANLIDPDENDKNFHLLKPVPKKNKKANADSKNDDHTEMRNEINTPTTENLRNTFVIKNQNEGFDHYYHTMKKRKGDTVKHKSMFVGMFNQCLKPCGRPTARDGHSCNVYKNRLYIFGGDRHHMPFNDIYSLEL
jgi:N-acetylneuraminic acid mutarotase